MSNNNPFRKKNPYNNKPKFNSFRKKEKSNNALDIDIEKDSYIKSPELKCVYSINNSNIYFSQIIPPRGNRSMNQNIHQKKDNQKIIYEEIKTDINIDNPNIPNNNNVPLYERIKNRINNENLNPNILNPRLFQNNNNSYFDNNYINNNLNIQNKNPINNFNDIPDIEMSDESQNSRLNNNVHPQNFSNNIAIAQNENKLKDIKVLSPRNNILKYEILEPKKHKPLNNSLNISPNKSLNNSGNLLSNNYGNSNTVPNPLNQYINNFNNNYRNNQSNNVGNLLNRINNISMNKQNDNPFFENIDNPFNRYFDNNLNRIMNSPPDSNDNNSFYNRSLSSISGEVEREAFKLNSRNIDASNSLTKLENQVNRYKTIIKKKATEGFTPKLLSIFITYIRDYDDDQKWRSLFEYMSNENGYVYTCVVKDIIPRRNNKCKFHFYCQFKEKVELRLSELNDLKIDVLNIPAVKVKIIMLENGIKVFEDGFPYEKGTLTIEKIKKMSHEEREKLSVYYFGIVEKLNRFDTNVNQEKTPFKFVDVYYIQANDFREKREIIHAVSFYLKNTKVPYDVLYYKNNFWFGISNNVTPVAVYFNFSDNEIPYEEFIRFIGSVKYEMDIKGSYHYNLYRKIIIISATKVDDLYSHREYKDNFRELMRVYTYDDIKDVDDFNTIFGINNL